MNQTTGANMAIAEWRAHLSLRSDAETREALRCIAALEAERDRLRAALLQVQEALHSHHNGKVPARKCAMPSCCIGSAALEPAP